jgi:virginiamycin B lyase
MSFLGGLRAGSAGGGRRRAVTVVVGSLCGLVVGAWPAVGTAFAVPHIYWSNRVVFTIGEASLDGTGVNQNFIGAGNGPQGLAVDGRHIYWPIVETGAIGVANLDGTGVNLNFITGANAPAGVAVDAQHVYWTNIGDNTIGVANLDGTGVNQSLISFADEPAEVAVDGRHIYWTNFGGNTIGEANKDGTAVNEFFITGVDSPGGVAVDGQHIYWTSVNGNTIGEANLDGTGVNQDFITGANAPDGLAVDGQHIYWTNSGDGTIGEANLDGTGVNQSFITGAIGQSGNPAVSVPVAQVGSMVPPPFANTPQGSLSAPLTVTLRNTGQRPLSLTGLSFAGADPSDFLVSTGSCLGNIDPGNSCQLQVYFSPQGQGARSATLQIATNGYANSPLGVQLAGTGAGISLVQGPAVPGPQGPVGPAGPPGPRGPAGARGAAGKVELITCKTATTTVTKKINGKRRKVKVKRQKCTGKLVSGKVKFKIRGAAARATISRKRTVYATGVRVSRTKRSSQLVVTDLLPLRRGRYTLTLQSRHGRRSMIRRTQITIT